MDNESASQLTIPNDDLVHFIPKTLNVFHVFDRKRLEHMLESLWHLCVASCAGEWHTRGSEPIWKVTETRHSDGQRKRTVSGSSPFSPLSKLVADCPQTSLLVLPSTNKVPRRAEQGAHQVLLLQQESVLAGTPVLSTKNNNNNISPQPWELDLSQRQSKVGGWMPVDVARRGSSLTLHLWFWSDWCWRLTPRLSVQLV